MNKQYIIEKFMECEVLENEMANIYTGLMNLTNDEVESNIYRKIIIDEEKHAIITSEIITILKND